MSRWTATYRLAPNVTRCGFAEAVGSRGELPTRSCSSRMTPSSSTSTCCCGAISLICSSRRSAVLHGTDEVLIAIKPPRDGRTLFELRTINGHWHCGGDQLTDTGTAADFDAWNHLQLALDTARQTYRVSLQVVGSAPRLLHEGRIGCASSRWHATRIGIGLPAQSPPPRWTGLRQSSRDAKTLEDWRRGNR